MQIKDVENLAELAKLELSENEKEVLLKDMESILSYVKQIEEVQLPKEDEKENIEDLTLYNIWREDLPKIDFVEDFSRDLIIKQFPDSKDDFVKVKKIL